jgi:hypothetical protein
VPLYGRRKRFCSDRCRYKGQKRERIYEFSGYARMVIARIRKMAERADGDIAALPWLAAAAEASRDALAAAVDRCRAGGYSDAEIGQALGTTRQAVGQRFGRKREVYAGRPETGAAG